MGIAAAAYNGEQVPSLRAGGWRIVAAT